MRISALLITSIIVVGIPAVAFAQTPAFNPSNPAASGYNIVFEDDFTCLSTISLSPTNAPGYKWYTDNYIYGETTPSSVFSLAPEGGLIITPVDGLNMALASAALPYPSHTGGGTIYTSGTNGSAPTTSANAGFVGEVFNNGWYIEASMSFNGSLTKPFSAGKGWPSFWTLPIEKAGALGGDQWKGQATGYLHYIENDMFEMFSNVSASSVHDWYGIYNVTCSSYCNETNSNNTVSAPAFTSGVFHTFGQLWVPGSAANGDKGSITNYIDGKQTNSVSWVDTGVGTPPPKGAFTWSVIDSQHLYVIFGSTEGQALTIKYVKVWQN
jgi:hypothetical protein